VAHGRQQPRGTPHPDRSAIRQARASAVAHSNACEAATHRPALTSNQAAGAGAQVRHASATVTPALRDAPGARGRTGRKHKQGDVLLLPRPPAPGARRFAGPTSQASHMLMRYCIAS